MKKISNKPKDWVKSFFITVGILSIVCLFADCEIFLELIMVSLFSSFGGYILFSAINILIYNKKIVKRFGNGNYSDLKHKQKD